MINQSYCQFPERETPLYPLGEGKRVVQGAEAQQECWFTNELVRGYRGHHGVMNSRDSLRWSLQLPFSDLDPSVHGAESASENAKERHLIQEMRGSRPAEENTNRRRTSWRTERTTEWRVNPGSV